MSSRGKLLNPQMQLDELPDVRALCGRGYPRLQLICISVRQHTRRSHGCEDDEHDLHAARLSSCSFSWSRTRSYGAVALIRRYAGCEDRDALRWPYCYAQYA